MTDYPCGNGSMAEPMVYPIGASTERWTCPDCGRRVLRCDRSYFNPSVCVACAVGQRKW